jgi:hypothetical protein
MSDYVDLLAGWWQAGRVRGKEEKSSLKKLLVNAFANPNEVKKQKQ